MQVFLYFSGSLTRLSRFRKKRYRTPPAAVSRFPSCLNRGARCRSHRLPADRTFPGERSGVKEKGTSHLLLTSQEKCGILYLNKKHWRASTMRKSFWSFLVPCILVLAMMISVFAGDDGIIPDETSVPLPSVPDQMASPNTTVTVTTRSGRTLHYLQYLGNAVPGDYPNASLYNATKIGNSSHFYNCHSYAWLYHGNMSSVSTSIQYWFNKPYELYSGNTTCYTRIYQCVSPSSISSSNIQVGDIFLWHYASGSDIISIPFGEGQNDSPHSAVVSSIQNGVIYLKSKWGEYGIYLHTLYAHPYVYDYTNSSSVYRPITVFRPNHTITPTLDPANPTYICLNESFHRTLCSQCGRYVVSTDSHNFVTIGGSIQRCTKCHYIMGGIINSTNEPL